MVFGRKLPPQELKDFWPFRGIILTVKSQSLHSFCHHRVGVGQMLRCPVKISCPVIAPVAAWFEVWALAFPILDLLAFELDMQGADLTIVHWDRLVRGI